MGVCIAPDIFQKQISALMDDLEFVRFYLDDLLVIKLRSFKDHLAKIKEVKKKLQPYELKWNIDNCKFAVPKVEYLGYIITREGIKVKQNKSKQLSNLNALTIKKQLSQFLVMVQYYCDSWPKCTDILAPLTELTKRWTHKKTSPLNGLQLVPRHSTNDTTHIQGFHPRLSRFLKTVHNPHRRIWHATDRSNHKRL